MERRSRGRGGEESDSGEGTWCLRSGGKRERRGFTCGGAALWHHSGPGNSTGSIRKQNPPPNGTGRRQVVQIVSKSCALTPAGKAVASIEGSTGVKSAGRHRLQRCGTASTALRALCRIISLKKEGRYHSLLVPLSDRGKVHSRPFSTRSIGGNANGFHGRRASHPSDAAPYPQAVSQWNLPKSFFVMRCVGCVLGTSICSSGQKFRLY